ncbi:MAG: hypothetical protein MUF42_01445 [Cytophagaceae bacterium]|nr:hypothetical protein [Cytophagaceae bacterium]
MNLNKHSLGYTKGPYFAIVPGVLIALTIAISYFSFGLNDNSEESGRLANIAYLRLGLSFTYLLANAFIALVIFEYKEIKSLIYLHIGYAMMVLWELNDEVNNIQQESALPFLFFLTSSVMDIMTMVYAGQIQNQGLRNIFRPFAISVVVAKIIGIAAEFVLSLEGLEVLQLLSSTAIHVLLMYFFWKLPSVPLDPDTDAPREDGDLLHKSDLED